MDLLYVIIDIFSRYVTGWMAATRESAAMAEKLIDATCAKHQISPGQLTMLLTITYYVSVHNHARRPRSPRTGSPVRGQVFDGAAQPAGGHAESTVRLSDSAASAAGRSYGRRPE